MLPRFELAAFRSKVARRVFLLFVLASLIPLAGTAVLVLLQVRGTLEARAREQLQDSARNYGQLIYERLLMASDILPELVAGRWESGDGPFEAIAVFAGETLQTVRGEWPPVRRPQLSSGGKPALIVADEGVMIARATPLGIVIGRLRPTYLWGVVDLLAFGTELCVLDAQDFAAVFCSAPLPSAARSRIRQAVAATATGSLAWEADENAKLAGYWQLFVASRFEGQSLDIVVTQDRAVALASLLAFNRIVPPVLLLSLVLAMLLAISQIRRSMRPLDQLLRWARQFGERQFGSRIALDSNDEFKDLADAMNTMADRLGEQFAALTALAEVDRLILASEALEQVVETILDRIADIAPRHALSILLLDADGSENGSLYTRKDGDEVATTLRRVPVPAETRLALGAAEQHAVLAARCLLGDERSLAEIFGWPVSIAIPISAGGRHYGALLLERVGESAREATDLAGLNEIADRLAVAISARERERELLRRAQFDLLTGLPNRQLCLDRLRQAMARARRENQRVAVLFIDLDDFKNVNDSLGHAVGDVVLREAAQRLVGALRDTETVARLGGDEYVVIISNVTDAELYTALAKITQTLGRPFYVDGSEVSLSASIGVTLFPEDGDSTSELLRRADTAMYGAKEAGRNRYMFFSSDMDARAHERLSLAVDVRHAFERGEFFLVYQPQMQLATHEIVGAEVLMRWQHPQRGLVPPEQFIPVLEEHGALSEVGCWQLDAALAQLKLWRSRGLALQRLAVNISARQLLAPDFVMQISALLEKHGLAGECLELELTERGFVEDFARANAVLEALRTHGVFISIDDFGTGYSSFGYLKDLAFDALKIDRAFVTDLPGERSRAIVRAIAAVAKTLGKGTVAEGVETAEQLQQLRQLGCDVGQGYLLSRPLPTAAFEAWLSALLPDGERESAPVWLDVPLGEAPAPEEILLEPTAVQRRVAR